MKVVLLAGGLGTRLSEETEVRPKPMVEVGGKPIIWHIMKHYARFSHNDFFIALGYKGEVIKRYFLDYYALNGNMTIDLRTGAVETYENECEDWLLHLIDTGQKSMTGGRLGRMKQWIGNEPFMVTYGDGVSNVDIDKLLSFHKSHGKIGTITAVRPPARFGGIEFEGNLIKNFTEKPQIGEGWINGGFMVFEPQVMDYISSDDCVLECEVMENLVADGQLAAYKHEGFWQCMDTLRDLRLLESLWQSGKAPWKTWEDEIENICRTDLLAA